MRQGLVFDDLKNKICNTEDTGDLHCEAGDILENFLLKAAEPGPVANCSLTLGFPEKNTHTYTTPAF